MEMEMETKPSTARIVSTGQFIVGALVLAGAAWVVGASPPALGPAAGYAVVLFALLLVVGAAYWLAGWGLWRRGDWVGAAAIAVGGSTLFALTALINRLPAPLSVLAGFTLVSAGAEAIAYLLLRPRHTPRPDRSTSARAAHHLPGWLVVKSGARLGQRLDVAPEMRIGRSPECDVRLDDQLVSGAHARLRVEHGQVYVYDLGSRSGTWVNDRSVQRHLLYDGALIRLGGTTFEFKKAAAR
jgi:hypothetical protein